MASINLISDEELAVMRESGRLLAMVFDYLDSFIETGISISVHSLFLRLHSFKEQVSWSFGFLSAGDVCGAKWSAGHCFRPCVLACSFLFGCYVSKPGDF